MIPAKHANALYFTPRTPWGTRVPRRALRSHMQASEDASKQPDLLPQELRRLNAPKGPPDQAYLDHNGVPRTLLGQLPPGGNDDKRWKVPHYDAPALPSSQRPQPEYLKRPVMGPSNQGLNLPPSNEQTLRISDLVDQQQKNKSPTGSIRISAGGDHPGGVSAAVGYYTGPHPQGKPPLPGPNEMRGGKGTETNDPDEEQREKDEDELLEGSHEK